MEIQYVTMCGLCWVWWHLCHHEVGNVPMLHFYRHYSNSNLHNLLLVCGLTKLCCMLGGCFMFNARPISSSLHTFHNCFMRLPRQQKHYHRRQNRVEGTLKHMRNYCDCSGGMWILAATTINNNNYYNNQTSCFLTWKKGWRSLAECKCPH